MKQRSLITVITGGMGAYFFNDHIEYMIMGAHGGRLLEYGCLLLFRMACAVFNP